MGEAKAGVGFGDTDKLVVLGDALGARKGAGFDLAGTEANGEMGDRNIFSFTRTMRHDGVVASVLSKQDCVDSLGEGTNLIRLNQNRIGAFFVNATLQKFDVGDE